MKSYIVLIVLAASVGAATALHAYKTKQPTELDKISQSLEGTRKLLPTNSHISFKGEASKSELLPWARYALVPRYLDPKGGYDTTLLIRYKANGDSTLGSFESSRRVLWQHTDSLYHYSISTAH